MMSKFALPYLLKSENPQSLESPPVGSLSPPLKPDTGGWFRLCGTGYTMAKFDMTLAALGMAEEMKGKSDSVVFGPRLPLQRQLSICLLEMLECKRVVKSRSWQMRHIGFCLRNTKTYPVNVLWMM